MNSPMLGNISTSPRPAMPSICKLPFVTEITGEPNELIAPKKLHRSLVLSERLQRTRNMIAPGESNRG
jgi:hypothetical protein